MNMKKNLNEVSTNDLMLSLLISEVGTKRFRELQEGLSSRLSDNGKKDLFSHLELPLIICAERLGERAGEEGGLAGDFIEGLDASELTGVGNPPLMSHPELLLHSLLAVISAGDLRKALSFVEQHVSMVAMPVLSAETGKVLEAYRGHPASGNRADLAAMGAYIAERIPAKLQGPTRAPRGDTGGLLEALMGLLGAPGDGLPEGMTVINLNDLAPPPSLSVAPGLRLSLRDALRVKSVPNGMFPEVQKLLDDSPELAAQFSVDRFLDTELAAFTVDRDKLERELFRDSQDPIEHFGKKMWLQCIDCLAVLFGDTKEAEVETLCLMIENNEVQVQDGTGYSDGDLKVPTPACDCVACGVIKKMATKGIRFHGSTGDVVRTAPTQL